ncbi:MAG: hypothetical protein M3296_09295, partial [Actinomycetota bacterium]|nr:hypothetical protein [Actinomycetota bacterium]
AAVMDWTPEPRAFRPHVTVARVRGGRTAAVTELAPPPLLAFAPEALTLYRSQPGRRGSHYEALARVELD